MGTADERKVASGVGRTDPPRRHLSTALILILFYIPLVIIPWVATCILNSRPVVPNGTTYEKSDGHFSPADLATVDRWMMAIRALNTAAAIFAVPVISAVLAHAAVVVAQRRSASNKLSARELLSLSDGSWARITNNFAARFTVFGLAFIIFSVALPLVKSILVSPEQVRVSTCLDDPAREYKGSGCEASVGSRFVTVGQDAEPADISRLPQDSVMSRVADRIIGDSFTTRQMYMWQDNSGNSSFKRVGTASDAGALMRLSGPDEAKNPFFASAMPTGLNTGLLRHHAMRLNSTVRCQNIAIEQFPERCGGPRPLEGILYPATGLFSIRYCLPGAFDASPWQLNRTRQELEEELFISARQLLPPTENEQQTLPVANFTAKCVVSTTRGYFELPNYSNGGVSGPLLNQWPSSSELRAEKFSDRLPTGGTPTDLDEGNSAQPLTFPSRSTFGTQDLRTPGPLMTTFLAALGNGSFFYHINKTDAETGSSIQVLTAVCARGLPFANMLSGPATPSDDCNDLPGSIFREVGERKDQGISVNEYDIARDRLRRLALNWFAGLNPAEKEEGEGNRPSVEAKIGAGVFLANEAVLMRAAELGSGAGTSRPIYFAEGAVVTKPGMSLVAMVILTVLQVVQILILLLLAVLAYSSRTHGSRIDGASLLLAGAMMRDKLLLPDGSGVAVSKKTINASAAMNAVASGGRFRGDGDDDDDCAPLTRGGRSRGSVTPPPTLVLQGLDYVRPPSRSSTGFGYYDAIPPPPPVLPLNLSFSRPGSRTTTRSPPEYQRHAPPQPQSLSSSQPVSQPVSQPASQPVSQPASQPSSQSSQQHKYNMEERESPSHTGLYAFHLPSPQRDGVRSPSSTSSSRHAQQRSFTLPIASTNLFSVPTPVSSSLNPGSSNRVSVAGKIVGAEESERSVRATGSRADRRSLAPLTVRQGSGGAGGAGADDDDEPVSPMSDDGMGAKQEQQFYGIAS